jgi:hypothetical protein
MLKAIVCIICKNPIGHNSLQLPDCIKINQMEIEAWNPQEPLAPGASTIYKGPGLFMCHNCKEKIDSAINLNARNIGIEEPEKT